MRVPKSCCNIAIRIAIWVGDNFVNVATTTVAVFANWWGSVAHHPTLTAVLTGGSVILTSGNCFIGTIKQGREQRLNLTGWLINLSGPVLGLSITIPLIIIYSFFNIDSTHHLSGTLNAVITIGATIASPGLKLLQDHICAIKSRIKKRTSVAPKDDDVSYDQSKVDEESIARNKEIFGRARNILDAIDSELSDVLEQFSQYLQRLILAREQKKAGHSVPADSQISPANLWSSYNSLMKRINRVEGDLKGEREEVSILSEIVADKQVCIKEVNMGDEELLRTIAAISILEYINIYISSIFKQLESIEEKHTLDVLEDLIIKMKGVYQKYQLLKSLERDDGSYPTFLFPTLANVQVFHALVPPPSSDFFGNAPFDFTEEFTYKIIDKFTLEHLHQMSREELKMFLCLPGINRSWHKLFDHPVLKEKREQAKEILHKKFHVSFANLKPDIAFTAKLDIEKQVDTGILALSLREDILRDNARQIGFTGNFLNDVSRDGHCVYHAILHQLFNNSYLFEIADSNRLTTDNSDSVATLRMMAVSYLRQNCQVFSEELVSLASTGMDTELLANYLFSIQSNQQLTSEIEVQLDPIFEKMATTSDWGGILQIRILAKILKLNAIIITENEYYVLQNPDASDKIICLAFDKGDGTSAAHYYSLIDAQRKLLPGEIDGLINSTSNYLNGKRVIRENLSMLPNAVSFLHKSPESSSLAQLRNRLIVNTNKQEEIEKQWYELDNIRKICRRIDIANRAKQQGLTAILFPHSKDSGADIISQLGIVNRSRIYKQKPTAAYFITTAFSEGVETHHYIFGIITENNNLIIIDPKGLSAQKELYTKLSAIKEQLQIGKIYISVTKIQYDRKGLTECGPISIELYNYLTTLPSAQLGKITENVKLETKYGTEYFTIDITSILPKALQGDETTYHSRLEKVRAEHEQLTVEYGEGENYVSNDPELNEKLLSEVSKEAEIDRYVRLVKEETDDYSVSVQSEEEADDYLSGVNSEKEDAATLEDKTSIFCEHKSMLFFKSAIMGSNDNEGSLENGKIVRSSIQNSFEEF